MFWFSQDSLSLSMGKPKTCNEELRREYRLNAHILESLSPHMRTQFSQGDN